MDYNNLKKLYFWIFCVGFILCNLNVLSHAGKYTDAFQEEVTRREYGRFSCVLETKDNSYTYTTQIETEAGHSMGPYGITKHYKKVPVTKTISSSYKKCKYCSSREDIPPFSRITFYEKDNTHIMVLTNYPKPCSKPQLSEDLAALWKDWKEWQESRTTSFPKRNVWEHLWSTARRLDKEEGAAVESDEILPKDNYIVEHKCDSSSSTSSTSSCCTIL